MSDRIEEIDVQQGIRMAWHKKTQIKEDLSLEDNVLRTWDAVAKPLAIIFPTVHVMIPDMQLVCSDNQEILLGHPYNPETYVPLTNEKFLEVIQLAVSGTQHKVVSCGSVRSRGRTFVSLSLEGLGSFTAAGHHFDPYLNFGNSFDKSCEFWYNTSATDSVCDNTVSMNIAKVMRGDGFGESRRHTPGLIADLPAIADIIDSAVGVQKEFAMAFEWMAQEVVEKDTAAAVFTGFVADPESDELSSRGKNLANRLVDYFENGPGNHGHSRADMFGAVTQHYTHGTKNSFRNFASSEFGFGAQRKRDFLQVLTTEGKFIKVHDRGVKLLAGANE